jgi:mono/diheme cytochrome c family protein
MRTTWSACLAAGALAVSLAVACSKGGGDGATTGATSEPRPAPALGDPSRGAVVFAAHCALCHDTTGREAGPGPSLTGERRRKSYDETVAWIENPRPPMPMLYPQPLSESDVRDVAAYVQKL